MQVTTAISDRGGPSPRFGLYVFAWPGCHATPTPMRFFAFKDPEQQTKDQIEMVRCHPWISKEIPVRGFIFDVNTGRLREVLAHAEARS